MQCTSVSHSSMYSRLHMRAMHALLLDALSYAVGPLHTLFSMSPSAQHPIDTVTFTHTSTPWPGMITAGAEAKLPSIMAQGSHARPHHPCRSLQSRQARQVGRPSSTPSFSPACPAYLHKLHESHPHSAYHHYISNRQHAAQEKSQIQRLGTHPRQLRHIKKSM